MRVAGKIFVNYRRDDAKAEAARLHDKLALHFGAANVFMDVDNLLPGERFDLKLQKALAETDIFLAVIGARWLELLEARAGAGERDYVREEIAAALARKIVVIPVPMDGAPLPKADSLPADIRELVLYHKQGVAHESFGRDVAALVQAIEAHRQARGLSKLEKALTENEVARRERDAERRERERQEAGEGVARRAQARNAAAGGGSWMPAAVAVAVGAVVVAGLLITHPWNGKPASGPPPAQQETTAAVPVKPVPGESFKDCSGCPEMVMLPAGSFMMGSPPGEDGRNDDEGPQHRVTIEKPFAVGKFTVTFDEWAACVSGGGCKGNPSPSDAGWGKGRRPVITVSFDDAKEYVEWLSQKTGKKYRLLSEAEWEYAARAGTRTRYFWGDNVGSNNANCNGCGSAWDNKKTAEVGQFQPNAFGLYDMAGNVWQWTEDCWNGNYNGAPDDGSAMRSGDCSRSVFRGGSWPEPPRYLRAAARGGFSLSYGRYKNFGFRVARTF